MESLMEYKEKILSQGYGVEDVDARLCQDIVLKALEKSSLCENATIKGGVVMRSISGNYRRATQDIDIDFIRYSLSDESIDNFIKKLNCLSGVFIERIGKITELKQQDYHGKRVHIVIRDINGTEITSKIDFGVHKNLEIEQEKYCFDIYIDDEGASLLMNSAEQIFAEKLKSLLKLGKFSTRIKDVFDLYYLIDVVSIDKLKECLQVYIYDNNSMRENNIEDVKNRLKDTFKDQVYISTLKMTDKNWVETDADLVVEKIENFFSLEELK